jgi:hypothetical protein
VYHVASRRPIYPSSGPWILGGGVPVVLDDWLCPVAIPPGFHCVPKDRRWGLKLGDWELVSSETLHRESRSNLPLACAREIFAGYWGGYMNQRELAEARGVSRLTIHRLVHKITYWFI